MVGMPKMFYVWVQIIKNESWMMIGLFMLGFLPSSPGHPIDAPFAWAYQNNTYKTHQKNNSFLRILQGLSLVVHKYSNRHIYGQDKRSNPGKKAQYQQHGCKYFCKDTQNQGPTVTNMKRIEKVVLQVAVIGQLGNTMIEENHDSQTRPQQKHG